MDKLAFLEMYLDLYRNYFTVLEAMKAENSDIVVLDIRNAPSQIKKE